MKRCRVFLALIIVVAFSGFVFAGSSGDEALQKLMDGNKRYVEGKLAGKDLGDSKRKELLKGQKPFAIVVTCSDSRVPPELLFDQGLGDVFVIRVAGNVVDPIALGSIEYGAEHLHSPLLVILGHSNCGAVAATIETKGKAEGNIGAIVKKIKPAADAAKKKGGSKEQILDAAVQQNVKNVYGDVMSKSKIVPELVHEGKLKVVAAEYMLDSGKVEMIDLSKAKTCHHKKAEKKGEKSEK